MGDPKKARKTYETPMHPWNKGRIEEENVLVKEYGMKNKREIYKMRSILKNFKDQAKNLIALKTSQGAKEKSQMLAKLTRLGLLKQQTDSLDPILDLMLRDILERRLQTQVYKKGLARSVDQARQFIIHGHITVADKKMTSPSYMLMVAEEAALNFAPNSALNNIDHPERLVNEGKPVEKKVKEGARETKRKGRGDKWKKDAEKGATKGKEEKKSANAKNEKKEVAGGVKNE